MKNEPEFQFPSTPLKREEISRSEFVEYGLKFWLIKEKVEGVIGERIELQDPPASVNIIH
jgi:hypothetical protein